MKLTNRAFNLIPHKKAAIFPSAHLPSNLNGGAMTAEVTGRAKRGVPVHSGVMTTGRKWRGNDAINKS